MANKLFLSLACLVISTMALPQQTIIKYLSGLDNNDTITWEFYCTSGRNSGQWTHIKVPSCWELQGFGTYHYGDDPMAADERGLYRQNFYAPAEWKMKKIYLVFEGSMTDTDVRINGKTAGDIHQGAFYRFQYDVTKLIKLGKVNLLEVTVSKRSTNESVNAAERKADYWVFGGIFRPVYLKVVPENHIDRIAIDARADGTFTMDVFHENIKGPFYLVARIQDLQGNDVGDPFSATVTKGSLKSRLTTTLDNPNLWSPEFPHLCQVVVQLIKKDRVLHEITERFGFRTIEFRYRNGIYVNGVKIKFKGVNRHSFWPESGRTTSKSLSIQDVILIKEMNMNAVRMSHYPPDVHFLDACDSLGLFVLDELGGWQKPPYDTEVGKKLVKEMVIRDVNHPSIILWDNGNEGGWNTDLDSEFSNYDIQRRHVIHPWAVFDGTDTQHYKPYNYGNGTLYQGREIFFPTEFLHGLYDGGHGAGLEDHWNLMRLNPLSAGGFLWCLIDEGVVRTDRGGIIDTDGNHAPDGILGPFREKEGSFYAIREIWSPVHISLEYVPESFDGNLLVENNYFYTNLKDCSFQWQLLKLPSPFDESHQPEIRHMPVASPDIKPGNTGILSLFLPGNWKDYDILYLTCKDPHDMEVLTWSWPLVMPKVFAERSLKELNRSEITVSESNDFLTLKTGKTEIKFNKSTGFLEQVKAGEQILPLSHGPVIHSTHEAKFRSLEHEKDGENHTIRINFENESDKIIWRITPEFIQLDYEYLLEGTFDFAGISFDFPDSLVTGITWLGDGPYRVWKNRLRGPEFGVWHKEYNNTVTGESWIYPEFKGYHSNLYWLRLENSIQPFYIFSATEDIFLHLFTPDPPAGAYNDNNSPPFPDGDLSFLHAIPPIGTKFRPASDHGPSGQPNMFFPHGEKGVKKGRLYFVFE